MINDDAAHQFTLSLSPDRNIVQPGSPEVFDIVMTNNGTAATTYDLSVSGLPAGVSSSFSQSSVTIQPGQSITAGNNAVTLTLTESGDYARGRQLHRDRDGRGGKRNHPEHSRAAHSS